MRASTRIRDGLTRICSQELEEIRATFAKFEEQKRSLDEQYADADEKKEDFIQEQKEMAEVSFVILFSHVHC